MGDRTKVLSLPLLAYLLLLILHPTSSSCPIPTSEIRNGNVDPRSMQQQKSRGRWPNGAKINVECHSGFRIRLQEFSNLVCTKGKWTSSSGDPLMMDGSSSICVADRCREPPKIENGYYHPEQADAHFPSTTYPRGTFLQAFCESPFTLNCSGGRKCGRIVCSEEGVWSSANGGGIITQCNSYPVPVMGSQQNGNGHHRAESRSSLTNYLVPILTIITILVVSSIAIFLLRKCQLLCRKRRCQSEGMVEGGNSVGGGGGRQQQYVSVRPGQGGGGMSELDAFNVANNTGIFLPGVGYDLQDCNFQQSPIVGTSVFK